MTYAIWQVYIKSDGNFIYSELLKVKTAGRWKNSTNEGRNYHAHLIPVLRQDGKQIWFTATNGKYTFEDYKQRGVTPWEFEGVYLADLEHLIEVPSPPEHVKVSVK